MSTTTTNQVVREAPEIEAYKLGLLESARNIEAPTLSPYQIEGMTKDQIEALERGRQGIGAYQPFLQAGQQAMDLAMLGMSNQMQPIGQEQIQQYMNPYQKEVLDQQLQEMNRQAEIQRQGIGSQAVRSGAFGGSRQAIQEAELARNLSQTQNQAIAQSMQQNYAQGLAAAQQQQQQLASMANAFGNLGIQQAALGQTAQQLGQQDVNFLYNLGQSQQAQSQAELDALRASNLQQAMQPYQHLAFLSDIYKGAPSTQMATSEVTKPTPSPFMQSAGLLLGGIGALGAAKTAGLGLL